MASSTNEAAKRVLLADPNLVRFFGSSFEQIAGPTTDKLPTTAETIKGNYISPLRILSELGVDVGSTSKVYGDVLDFLRRESPVELFVHYYGARQHKGYFVPVSKKYQLKDFLRDKLHQIGLRVK